MAPNREAVLCLYNCFLGPLCSKLSFLLKFSALKIAFGSLTFVHKLDCLGVTMAKFKGRNLLEKKKQF